jgi:hypothetical protein
MNLKTVKLKTTPHSEGLATLQNPQAKVGASGDCITYEVIDVPSDVSHHEVIRRFNAACQVSGYSFEFSTLVPGAILFGK